MNNKNIGTFEEERKSILGTIKKRRQDLKLSQQEVARRINMDKGAYSKLENGKTKKLDFYRIWQIALALDLSLRDLFKIQAKIVRIVSPNLRLHAQNGILNYRLNKACIQIERLENENEVLSKELKLAQETIENEHVSFENIWKMTDELEQLAKENDKRLGRKVTNPEKIRPERMPKGLIS